MRLRGLGILPHLRVHGEVMHGRGLKGKEGATSLGFSRIRVDVGRESLVENERIAGSTV